MKNNKRSSIRKKRIKRIILERLLLLKKQNKRTALQKRLSVVKKKNKRNIFKRILFLFLFLFFLGAGFFLLWVSSLKIPDINVIHQMKIAQSTKIYDKNGELLYRLYGDESRTVVPISKISKHALDAAVAVEDKDFYEHNGVKPTSIIKSAYENLTHKRRYSRGGSTITQQVIKNTILTPEKTITRKIKEAILAYKLEKIWSKEQILELYLNETPYGSTIYGVEEAAVYYFGKHASDLSIEESAYLAAMTQAPTTYSPYGKHRKLLDERKNLVLTLMLNQGYINLKEFKEARDTEISFTLKKGNQRIKAPHFVMFVVKKLEDEYGDDVRTAGLKVYTTLDLKLQEKLEKIAKDSITEASKKFKVSNTGIVAIETQTGHILAMVGSKDYFDKTIDGKYNIATALRQPGSSFKPIVYLAALEKGYTPKTVLWDVDTEFSVRCKPKFDEDGNKIILSKATKKALGCYNPQDFDGKFKGPMLLENALPESRNIPAVKALYLVGVKNAIERAKEFGVKSLDKSPDYYGLNLVLGGGEVKLLNMVSTYATFANEGVRVEPSSITKIEDNKGKTIYESEVKQTRVVKSKYVQHLNKMLSNNDLKRPTFGSYSPLYFYDRDVASKTGTTNDYKDFWAIGYDPGDVAVGVWVGNNDNTSGESFAAGKTAHKIWKKAMTEALKDYPIRSFPDPEPLVSSEDKNVFRGIYVGGTSIKIDTATGKLATEDTPEEFIKEIVIPDYHSILHWVNKENPRGPIPEHKDGLYENWEIGVQEWAKGHKDKVTQDIQDSLGELINVFGDVDGFMSIINGESDVEDKNNTSGKILKDDLTFKILSPGDGDLYRDDESVFIKIIDRDSKIIDFSFYLNDKYIGSNQQGSLSFVLSDIDGVQNENILKIVAEDKDGFRTIQEVKLILR